MSTEREEDRQTGGGAAWGALFALAVWGAVALWIVN